MIELYTTQQNITKHDISAEKKHIFGDFATHWHDFFEIEFILSGSGEYAIDGLSYPIKPGMIFFMTPINFHQLKNADAEIVNIMFSHHLSTPDVLFPLSEHGIEHAISFSSTEADFITSLLNELCIAVKEEDITYATTLLHSLLCKLGKSTKKEHTARPAYIQTAMLYLQNHFRSRVTLTAVAEMLNLSPAYLSHIFRKETGIGFKKYLNSLRFEYAKKLLLYSHLSVSEICFESGFEDYANFLRGFKQHYNLPPGQFRQKKKAIER
ncbi:MAG: helix-turn-helix domain-containing protein [Clostridia bacterium]|nr:helix-turn-helix domain-containing protein [Clostridia bacterium]